MIVQNIYNYSSKMFQEMLLQTLCDFPKNIIMEQIKVFQ